MHENKEKTVQISIVHVHMGSHYPARHGATNALFSQKRDGETRKEKSKQGQTQVQPVRRGAERRRPSLAPGLSISMKNILVEGTKEGANINIFVITATQEAWP